MLPFISNIDGQIKDGDAIIFANFRPDRAIRIATAFSNPSAASHYVSEGKPTLDASNIPNHLFFVSMMHYSETVKGPIAFPLQSHEQYVSKIMSYGDGISISYRNIDRFHDLESKIDHYIKNK